MRKTLEAQYPGVTFDWKAFQSTPMPAQEPEYWRERRRAERAAKQARQLDEMTGEELELAGGASEEGVESPVFQMSEPGSAGPAGSEGLPETGPLDGTTSGLDRRVAGSGPNPNQPERRRSRRGGRRRRARMGMGPEADKAWTGSPPAAERASEELDEPLEAPGDAGESDQE